MLATLGDGGYEIGSRARIIRDRLLATNRFAPRDLLAIQLDTSADFLERWREVILRTLSDGAAGDANRAELRDILENGWSGQAAADSAAYRLTRTFRDIVSERVIEFVLVECYEADATFDYTTIRRRDAAIWTIVNEQPQHLLDPQYATWTDFLTAAVDTAIEQAMRGEEGTPPRPGVVGLQRRRVPASTERRTPVRGPIAGHANRRTPGRSVHAAHALGSGRGIGADGRLTRTGGRRHHAHAYRPERTPVVTLLREFASGLACGRGHTVPSGIPGPLADADAVDGPSALRRTVTRSRDFHGRRLDDLASP